MATDDSSSPRRDPARMETSCLAGQRGTEQVDPARRASGTPTIDQPNSTNDLVAMVIPTVAPPTAGSVGGVIDLPLIVPLIGLAAGTARGGPDDAGIDDPFRKRLGSSVISGGAALILLARKPYNALRDSTPTAPGSSRSRWTMRPRCACAKRSRPKRPSRPSDPGPFRPDATGIGEPVAARRDARFAEHPASRTMRCWNGRRVSPRRR